jgi:alpha-tubulin suppressor-like RCC1 family protein
MVAVLVGGAGALDAAGPADGARVPHFKGAAPGSMTCSMLATVRFTPPLTDSGGGTSPSTVTGRLSDCNPSVGTVTIKSGRVRGTFAPSSPQNCASLSSLSTPATLTVLWKGAVNGSVGTTTYGGKASFTTSTLQSGGESVVNSSQVGFPTPANPADTVAGSFAGGANGLLKTAYTTGSLAPVCDTKATGGHGDGLKRLTLVGTITIGLNQTNPLTGAVTLVTDAHESYCAILTTGAIQCWGDNATGELGDGNTTTTSVAESVSGITSATALASDGAHSYCAILASRAVDCWGSNDSGELGNGTTTDSSVPVAVSGITTATAITGDGDGSYCAVLESGTVDCWGANGLGQLGNDMTVDSSVPVGAKGITTAVSVTGDGDGSYCAVSTTDTVDCWGYNGFGQLGDGGTANSSVPVAATGLADVNNLSSDGDDSFCAELSSETVDCWGANFAGELGDGTTTESTVPVAVTGISTASAISDDGAESYCALLTSAAVDCWGYNGFGQLGDGATTNSSVPVAVSGISTAVSIVSDSENSYCAVVGSGGVDCWGANNSGELGNGTTTSSSIPVAVSGMTTAANVVGGANPSGDSQESYCAVVSSGKVSCWGSNQFGALGNATTTNSSTPVTVLEP